MRKLFILVCIAMLLLPAVSKGQEVVIFFSLGIHTDDDKDGKYIERYDQWLERYIRIYDTDGCVMSFYKDRNGGLHSTRWELYNHCVEVYG